jgi:LacI family transcriptional regulator
MTVESERAPGRGRPRRVTLADVARHAGVSVATASKAVRGAYGISPAMKERVTASIQELGYRPDRLARGMRGRTFTVGMTLPDIENPFFSLIVDGMTAPFREAGYDLLIAPTGNSPEVQDSIVNDLADHQMDGLVLLAPRGTPEHLEKIGAQIPVVVVGRHGPADNYDTVAGDDLAGSGLVVDHLVGLGHRRITFVAHEQKESYPGLLESVRQRGYRQAMTRHGLTEFIEVINSTWTYGGGRAAGADLAVHQDPPTAVFAGADITALGVLNELWESGIRVPGQMSVAGYDNSFTSALAPISLTTVDQSGTAMGRLAAQALLRRIHHRAEPRKLLMHPQLVVRRSTAAPHSAT